jgi:hypothetical protein
LVSANLSSRFVEIVFQCLRLKIFPLPAFVFASSPIVPVVAVKVIVFIIMPRMIALMAMATIILIVSPKLFRRRQNFSASVSYGFFDFHFDNFS